MVIPAMGQRQAEYRQTIGTKQQFQTKQQHGVRLNEPDHASANDNPE